MNRTPPGIAGSVELPLSQVVKRLEAAGLLLDSPAEDVVLRGICDDSRKVQPGDLFCAWSGTAADGHDFVGAAEAAGAVAVLVERPVPEHGMAQVVVRQGRHAAAQAASVVLGDPAAELALVGVTGTNGKTTTVWLLQHLLSRKYAVGSMGTLGVFFPDGRRLADAADLTTPGPVGAAVTLRALAHEGTEVVAMEVSSHALEQGRLSACSFRTGVFTNVGRDHLDYHGTTENYLSVKRGFVDLLAEDGVAVINGDDPAWDGLAELAPRAVCYGLRSGDVDVRATVLESGSSGSRFLLETVQDSQVVHLPLLGQYNVENALASAVAAMALGCSLQEVVAGLTDAPQVPGRLEVIASRPCPVLADYAHTPDALAGALAALRPLAPGRLIVVFGAGGERDVGKRSLMGQAAVAGADVVVVTSDNPRREDPESIIDHIVADLEPGSYSREVDRREAIRKALDLAGPDDVILLAGKGHEMYQVVGTDRLPFDERQVVSSLLASGAGQADAGS